MIGHPSASHDRHNPLTLSDRLPARPRRHGLSHPTISPDGRYVAFSAKRDVGILDLATGEVESLIEDAIAARYVSSGLLVFTEQPSALTYSGRVYAQPFDLETRDTRRPAVPVLSERGFWEFGLNTRGDLITNRGLEGRSTGSGMDIFTVDPETGEQGPVLRSLPPFSAIAVSQDASWYTHAVTTENELIVGRLGIVWPVWKRSAGPGRK